VWTKSGTYFDTIPNALGCDSFITINLTVNMVNIGVTHNHNTLSANAMGATYQWLDCEPGFLTLLGETNRIFTASFNGDYAVIVSENSCVDTSICYTISTTGVSDFTEANELSVYPNPAIGHFTISSKNPMTNAEIRILSVTGEILTKRTNLSGNEIIIDISDKAGGVYFIEIIEQEKVARFRIIKY
jgi:hypothetical protein